MVKKLLCATRFGIDAKIVEVEVTFTRGLPSFIITGLANNSIQEAKHRIQGVLSFNNFTFSNHKININLYPSDLPKSGSHFDLPIALLIALYKEDVKLDNWFAFGELGLDGNVKNSSLIYPLLLSIVQQKKNINVILPSEGKSLYSNIPNLNIYYASNFSKAIEIIREPKNRAVSYDFTFKSISINDKKYYYDDSYNEDFYDVKGQVLAKRAALIAAAGMHNIIFEGSPGSGKSMIAKRMQYILPPLSFEEMCECVKIKALGNNELAYSPRRPFRNPHQSSSKASILGSVSQNDIKPGDIALSHNGILFFDELSYFHRDIIESLREPLEDNKLSISRVNVKFTYPTSILFVGALNPCPCGNLFSIVKECRCSDLEIKKYQNKLSEPFKDRIDLFVKMDEKRSDDVIDSNTLFKQVLNVFNIQKSRSQNNFNGKLSDFDVDKFCILDSTSRFLLDKAITHFALSQRGIKKVMKVSRTIADLDSSEVIQKEHLMEALSFRPV